MFESLKLMLDWSEVWALLIPLTVVFVRKNKTQYLKPVRIFLAIALILNLCIDLISQYKVKWGFGPQDFLWNNNFLYNMESVVRLLLFSWFFILLGQRFMHRVKVL